MMQMQQQNQDTQLANPMNASSTMMGGMSMFSTDGMSMVKDVRIAGYPQLATMKFLQTEIHRQWNLAESYYGRHGDRNDVGRNDEHDDVYEWW